jgi:hypothetical protein
VWTCVNCYVFAGALDLDVGVPDRQSVSLPQGYSSDALDLGPGTGWAAKSAGNNPSGCYETATQRMTVCKRWSEAPPPVASSMKSEPLVPVSWPLMSAYLMSLMIVFLSC